MAEWELAARFVAGDDSRFDSQQMRAANLDSDQLAVLRKIRQNSSTTPFMFWRPRKAVTIEQIRAGIKMAKAKPRGCDLVVIDYLQKIRGSYRSVARHEQLEHIIYTSKDIASELSIPVVMLAQAKRPERQRPPILEDIKGSSAVEDEANNAWLLHREERNSTEATLIIAKERSGATGEVSLGYDLRRTEFTDPVSGSGF